MIPTKVFEIIVKQLIKKTGFKDFVLSTVVVALIVVGVYLILNR